LALIDVSIDKRVAEVTLNRPEKLNAMHEVMLEEFDAAIADLRDDRSVNCVLLKGAGRAFSVGYDLRGIGESGTGSLMDDLGRLVRHTESWQKVFDFPKPVIAAVHGYCMGGAAFLVSMTDMTVVAEDLSVAWARVPLGGGWMTQIFCHLVGPRKAKELSFIRGSQMTGAEAANIGWANYALPAGQVYAKAREMAEQTARVPLDLLMINKRAANRALERTGFREAITGGIEFNNIAHFTPGAQLVRSKLRELGIQGVIEWFDAGGTLDDSPELSSHS
jgi:enoyl-CoA hydratase